MDPLLGGVHWLVLLTVAYCARRHGSPEAGLLGDHPLPSKDQSWAAPTRQSVPALGQEEQRGFCNAWRAVNARFEGDPVAALIYADVLVSALLQRSGNLPAVQLRDQYRKAHELAARTTQRPVFLDDMRRAIEIYTDLFSRLTQAPMS
jgi:hypothetical protein